jgi:hypothetical protein
VPLWWQKTIHHCFHLGPWHEPILVSVLLMFDNGSAMIHMCDNTTEKVVSFSQLTRTLSTDIKLPLFLITRKNLWHHICWSFAHSQISSQNLPHSFPIFIRLPCHHLYTYFCVNMDQFPHSILSSGLVSYWGSNSFFIFHLFPTTL